MKQIKPKRNKKYVPRDVLQNPMHWAMAGVYVLPDAIKKDLKESIEHAYTTLAQGHAGRDIWCELMQALNTAEELCKVRICNNLLPQIEAAQNAMCDIAPRAMVGKAICRGTELAAIREGLDMHKIQLDFATQAEFSKCVHQVTQRIKSTQPDMLKELVAMERQAA